jgi:hypothetical protein
VQAAVAEVEEAVMPDVEVPAEWVDIVVAEKIHIRVPVMSHCPYQQRHARPLEYGVVLEGIHESDPWIRYESSTSL